MFLLDENKFKQKQFTIKEKRKIVRNNTRIKEKKRFFFIK